MCSCPARVPAAVSMYTVGEARGSLYSLDKSLFEELRLLGDRPAADDPKLTAQLRDPRQLSTVSEQLLEG